MSTEQLPIILRPATQDDVNFVLNSWLKSFKESSWFNISGKPYWRGHRLLILKLMRTKELTIACMKDDTNAIVGWSCTEPGVIHYVYVKRPFRRFGVAKTLLAWAYAPGEYNKSISYTHRTYHLNDIKLPTHWAFDMYPALMDKAEMEFYDEAA